MSRDSDEDDEGEYCRGRLLLPCLELSPFVIRGGSSSGPGDAGCTNIKSGVILLDLLCLLLRGGRVIDEEEDEAVAKGMLEFDDDDDIATSASEECERE